MADVATLGIAVDSAPVTRATGELGRFSTAADKAATGADTLAAANAKSEAQLRAIESAAKRAGISVAEYEGRMQRFKAATESNLSANVTGTSAMAASVARTVGSYNAVSLVLQTVTALASTYYALFANEGPKSETVLAEHARLLGLIKDGYDRATGAASNMWRQSQEVTRLQLMQQQLDVQEKLNQEVAKQLRSSLTVSVVANTVDVKPELEPFRNAIETLNKGWREGAPNVRAYVDEIARIGLMAPALQKLSVDLVASVGDASKFAQTLQQIQAMFKTTNGEKLGKDDRTVLGLPDPPKARAMADPFAQQVTSIQKHIAAVNADADAVGKTAGEHARLRTEAQLLEAAQQKGGTATDAQRKKIEELGQAAYDTAMKLAKMQVNDQIKFDKQTAFLSPEDVRIAQQLKGLFPDVATALGSVEAAAMRFNNQLKSINDIARQAAGQFANDLVSGLRSGEKAMDAIGHAAQNLSGMLTNSAITELLKGNLPGAALSGFGAIIAGDIGSAQRKRSASNDNDKEQNDDSDHRRAAAAA